MAEWKHIITEWLTEYASLQPHEIKSFAAEHEHNHEISTAIFSLLYCDSDKDTANTGSSQVGSEDQYEKMLEDVCTQLFSFYRSREVELQRFTLQFVPTLIYNYLSVVVQESKKSCRYIECLLIGLYNFEVVDEDGKPKVVSFRVPSLAQPSIYHEPLSLGPAFLTESALRRFEDCNTKLAGWGPHPQIETITPQNRLKVLTALLYITNQQLCWLQKVSLRHLCIAVSRIVTQGFQQKKNGSSSSPYNSAPRIPLTPSFMLELVEGAYFALFNEFYTLGSQAIKDIKQRAEYELFPDVMLVTSAVLNTLENNSPENSDGHLSMSTALSPSTTSVTMSKSMITNASFRTKKLPEDIPIQAGQPLPSDSDALTSITEEGETDSTPIQRGTGARTSKQAKLSSLIGKKSKETKDKSTEKKVTLKDSTKGIWNSLSGGGDVVDSQPRSEVDGNGSLKDEISMTSGVNSTENSDSRSQATTDSLDLDTAPRFAAMQVSSV